MSVLIARLFCVFAAVCFSANAFAQTDAEFAKANQEYAAGHFKEAVDTYEQCVRSGQSSANLFYDLGNAYFHTGDFGRAILNYERALQLDRHHPEAQANLRIARDEARSLEMAQGRAERLIQFAGPNEYAIIAAVAFWIGLFCFSAWALSRRRPGAALALSMASLLIGVANVAFVVLIENGSNGRGSAVVTGANVTARLATADNAQTVLPLPAGSEIKVLSRRGDWIYAALPNDLRGWIPAKAAESVRL
jgi:tetratricopeptide (TPR) repeat protein